ncbi:MAG: succinyl-diaminopimelate desuccinylase [Rhodospirillales bacterium]
MSDGNPVELSRALIRCPSITPVDAGALDVLQSYLEGVGFAVHRRVFEETGTDPVDNLYARIGPAGTDVANLCFAGHTDVVPPGDETAWQHPPFAAEIDGGMLYGRGTSDMKCAVAAFAVAAGRVAARGDGLQGAISMLITGDEEGVSINGTRKALGWISDMGERLSACLVGEPTNPGAVGELGGMVKIGRRGSLNGVLTVTGVQGHAAYPERADNPIPHLLGMLNALTDIPLDDGSEHFQPSTLTLTSVDVGNPATNVIPRRAEAKFNVRFNDTFTSETLIREIRRRLDSVGTAYDLDIRISGESFLSVPGPLADIVCDTVAETTGTRPVKSTTGGTSDARFIKDYCPVCEFGLYSDTAHKIDEHVPVADIERLTDIYEKVIDRYLAAAAA